MTEEHEMTDETKRPAVGRPVPERFGARVWQATRRMLCPHTHGRLVAIEWDGTAVHECTACSKQIYKGL